MGQEGPFELVREGARQARIWIRARRGEVHGVGHIRRLVIGRVDGSEARQLGVERIELVVRRIGGRTVPPAATDWISLVEAAEILSAANVRFRPATIGGWARAGKVQSIKLGGRRFVRRGEIKALVAAPRRVRAADLQPGLFEELGG